MRFGLTAAMAVFVCGCAAPHASQHVNARPDLVVAERLIDAFYSFDPAQLRVAMSDAPVSQPQLLYYQGWAKGGNYAVLERKPCRHAAGDEVSCEITVRDDLIAALGTGYWVTDTFHLTLRDGRIIKVRNSSNDPPDFDQALNWVKRERPDVMTGPCKGFFAGGPTPQDCVRAVVAGFAAYRAAHPRG
jgi:hypothetical protein